MAVDLGEAFAVSPIKTVRRWLCWHSWRQSQTSPGVSVCTRCGVRTRRVIGA